MQYATKSGMLKMRDSYPINISSMYAQLRDVISINFLLKTNN